MRSAFILLLAVAASMQVAAQSKKKKKSTEDEITQTLPVLKDPPQAVSAETARLVFHVSPLSSKGLLSQQVRDALKNLFQENHGAAIVKLRAFVAGSGDLRRVQQLVSETFTDHKLNLPALSTIQAGALPMEGVQVVIESIAVEKRTVNPEGLAFFSGQQTKDVRQSVAQLQKAVASVRVNAIDVVRATCFLSSLDNVAAARSAISGAFPNAAANYIQLQRDAAGPLAECEAIGRLATKPDQEMRLVNPAQLASSPNYAQIALVNSPKIVITGTQMAFGEQDSDIRLAFERVGKAIESSGASYREVFWTSWYPLTPATSDKIRALRFEFLDHAHPPAGTLLMFEGLPSLDASFAVDMMAIGQ